MSDIFTQLSPHVANADELRAFSDGKLFHQLMEASFTAVIDSTTLSSDLATKYFQEVIKPIGEKLNPVRFTEFTGLVLKKILAGKSVTEKLKFLEDNFRPLDATGYLSEATSSSSKNEDAKMTDSNDKKEEKGKMSHYSKAAYADFLDAKCLYLSFRCQICVEEKNYDAAKDSMDDLTSEIFKGSRQLTAIGPKVFSWYHMAQIRLYEATTDASKFYRAGVNYFLFTPMEVARRDFPQMEEIAIKLGLACLVAPGEYHMGELLELSLYKTPEIRSSWIYAMVFAFQEGSYELYDSAKSRFKSAIEASCVKFPAFSLKENEALVYEKFCACVLIEYAFRQPKSQRKLRLAKLREVIRLDDVETLLINSMCAGLVRGTIDQVEGTFRYEWVRPRVLDFPRLEVLESRLGDWITHQKAVLRRIEEMTPELLVTV